MSMCWDCCRSGPCTALHRDGAAHAQWCWAKGHGWIWSHWRGLLCTLGTRADVSLKARTPEGTSSELRAQGKPAGANMWTALWQQPVLHVYCAQSTWACSALQGATVCCGCFRVWCSLLLIHTSLSFGLENERQKGKLSQIWYLRPPWWQPVTPWQDRPLSPPEKAYGLPCSC